MAKLITTLAEMQKMYAEEAERRERKDRPKTNYLKLADGEAVTVWLLQELFTDSKNYDEELGHGLLAVEHKAGSNYKRKALCTIDEEGCVGCEQHQAGWRSNDGKDKKDPTRYTGNWGQSRRLYVNVLVERKDGTKEVAVLSQGDGAKSITPALFDHVTDNNTVIGARFKMTRKGDGKDNTSYLLAYKGEDEKFDPKQYKDEMFDLSYVVRKVPYEKQHAFYGVEREPDLTEEVTVPAASKQPESLQDIDW